MSLKPEGDVVTIHALNRGIDHVFHRLNAAREHGPLSITTAENASIIDPEQQPQIENDVDEAIWEEAETGLRHQSRVTANFVILMALGGAIAGAGLVAASVPQTIAFVAASIIAPGFEPIAKVPLGVVLRRWTVARRGVFATVVGYAVLIVAAALTFVVLRASGTTTVDAFIHNPEVERIAHPTFNDLWVSACAALAGMTIITAYRRSVIAGPLVALIIIPAAAMAGMALAAGQWALVGEALTRLGIDVLLIVVLGALVIGLKQALVHRRRPLV